MYLRITPEAEQTLSKLHLLEFYLLCPDGRRFPVADMCKEYEKKPDGIFLRSFEDRLVIVVEAVYPGQGEYNGSLSVMIGKNADTLYWRQAFYLSTGTSISWLRGRTASNDLRANTWMPFHGLNIQGSTSKTSYSFVLKARTELPPIFTGTNYYFEKLNHLESGIFQYKPEVPSQNKQRKYELEIAEDTSEIQTTYGSFLPEGDYSNLSERYQPIFDRFACVSYLLASHALGGNAFVLQTTSNTNENNYGKHTNNANHFPYLTNGYFPEKFPNLVKKIAPSSPVQACCLDAAKKVAITKPDVVNAFIDRHGAAGYMNAFRVIGEPDIQVPGLSVSSVPFTNLAYSASIQNYNHLVIEFVSFLFLKYKTKNITKEELQKQLQLSLPEIVALHNERTTTHPFFLTNEDGFTATLENYQAFKDYQGGRRSRRNRSHARRKRTRKHL